MTVCADRPAVDREALIDWVAQFLSYWECADMLADKAAKIIISEVFNAPYPGEDTSQNGLYQMPNPGSFFPDGQDQKKNKDIFVFIPLKQVN